VIFRGLKQHIVITLAGLVAIGMALVGMVVVILWQRDLMRAEVNHSQAILRLWGASERLSPKERSSQINDLQTICSAAGSSCRNVLLYTGNETVTLHREENHEILRDMKTTAVSGAGMVRFFGSSWGVYSPSSSSLFVSVPLKQGVGSSASLGMIVDMTSLHAHVRQQQSIIVVYILVNVLILAVVGFFRMLKLVVRPVEKLVTLSEAYKETEDFSFSLEQEGSEFGKLSLALNRMLARIESDRRRLRASVASLEQANNQLIASQKEMVRAEKLAAVGRLSAGLAHEIGNPLGIIQGYLELLENNDLQNEERHQFCQRSITELNRINKLVRQLLNLTRLPSGRSASTPVHTVLNDLVEILKTQKDMASIEIVQQCEDTSSQAAIDGAALHQVVLNCLLNAVDAIKEKNSGTPGKIVLSCETKRAPDESRLLLISIQDNGAGIDEAHLENIFDPFFTTKEPGKGTGLGLSVSHAIIEAAGGRMWVESRKDGGTIMRIELPVSDQVVETIHLHNSP
jgi:two-component system, NtrC family, sensor kinase